MQNAPLCEAFCIARKTMTALFNRHTNKYGRIQTDVYARVMHSTNERVQNLFISA